MRKRLAAAAIGLGLASVPALAIFGLGDIVFDPTSYGELVEQLAQMQQQYTQLVKTYKMVSSQYDQMVTNAKWISSKARWRAMLTPWTVPSATNTYGTTGGWISALNTGGNSLSGYGQAITVLKDYGPVWGSMDSSQQDHVARNYATVELSDGMTVNALDQLGAIRGNSTAVQNAIDMLESDSLSDSADLNTEVGVLNKINAAGIISLRNSQDANKLLASLLDHQMIAAKARRDAEAQSINTDIALRQMAPEVNAQHLGGASQVLTTYRPTVEGNGDGQRQLLRLGHAGHNATPDDAFRHLRDARTATVQGVRVDPRGVDRRPDCPRERIRRECSLRSICGSTHEHRLHLRNAGLLPEPDPRGRRELP